MTVKLNFCTFHNLDIFKQLQIEEALLRADDQNWCLINVGTPPAIVLGISGNPEELVDAEKLKQNPIPLIRRFSGGGTVVVDEHTLFISFLFSKKDIDLGTCPRKVMQWTEEIYKPVFAPESFSLQETDYVIGHKKIGGNAQYFSKDRTLHHTTFLWDYSLDHMSLLKMPSKTPEYRKGRSHEDFIDKLSNKFTSVHHIIDRLKNELKRRFQLEETSYSFEDVLQREHRKALELISI